MLLETRDLKRLSVDDEVNLRYFYVYLSKIILYMYT